jgi:hypothetical protein
VLGNKAAVPAAASAPTPAIGGAAQRWTVKPDRLSGSMELKIDPKASIEVPARGEVMYPSTPSKFVVVGENRQPNDVRELWNLQTMKREGAIQGKLDHSQKIAISPDGQYLAGRMTITRNAGVEVWSLQTGKLVRQIDTHTGPIQVELLDFAGPGQLLVGKYGQKGKHFQIWDITTGQLASEIPGPSFFHPDTPALSPGRQFLVVATLQDELLFYDLKAGSLAGKVTTPKGAKGGSLLCQGLQFSPDGSELAGLFSSGAESRLVAWNMASGEVAVDHGFGGDVKHIANRGHSYRGPAIEWLPDGSAWLLHGHGIIDRQSGRLVWLLRTPADDFSPGPRKMIDNDHALVTSGPQQSRSLVVVALPWAKIDAALKALESETPAHVRPGQSVSLKVEVGKVRFGTPADAKTSLEKALGERFEADGIHVADGQSLVLHLKYNEAEGERLEEMANKKGTGPGSALPPLPGLGNAVPTGRSVQATRATCELTLKADGNAKPLWSNQLDLDPKSLMIQGDATDSAARDAMFGMLTFQLLQQPIPYFLPKDDSVATLPGITELPGQTKSARPTNKATPKSTTRGKNG